MRSKPVVVLAAALFGLCLLLPACGREQSAPIFGDSQPAPAAAADAAGAAEKIKIKTPDDEAVVTFKPRGEEVKIEFAEEGGERVLRGRLKESGKRKYEDEGGGPVAEVKPGESGFKVRTPEGELLWKVKISAEKIKISDNEENRNPFVLRLSGEDRVKVLRDETTDLGRVKFYRDRGKVKVKDLADQTLFESNTERYSAMYGLLLLPEIPPAERYIVMAELLLRQR